MIANLMGFELKNYHCGFVKSQNQNRFQCDKFKSHFSPDRLFFTKKYKLLRRDSVDFRDVRVKVA